MLENAVIFQLVQLIFYTNFFDTKFSLQYFYVHIIQISYKSKFYGQLGNGFLGGELVNEGLVGNTFYSVTDKTNDLLCSLLGSNFLRVVLNNNDCPKSLMPRSKFQTKQSFCDFFNNCSPYIQQCLTDAAIRALVYVHGIVEYRFDLGTCCAGT